MPKLVLPVPETRESVLRPVVFDITRQLLKITGLSPQTRIVFPGDVDIDRQPGSTISDKELTNTFGANPKVTLDVEEDYEVDRILSTAVLRPENLFIFKDNRVDTYIKPAYSSTEMTINFRFRAADKVSAMRWRDDIKTRISMMRDEHLHDITYHYLIPKEYIVIMQEIHRLRENVAPYGEDFDTFFKNNLSKRASLLSNLNGAHQEWGVSEKQMRIVGWFDFEGAPEKGDHTGDDDSWTISFGYKFKYDKPIACVMSYPLVIHNQLLSRRFRPTEPNYQVEHHLRSYSHSAKCFGGFERMRDTQAVAALPGISIPVFDEFIPSSVQVKTLRVFTSLVTLDPAQPGLLFNLREISSTWKIDSEILEFMVAEREKLTVVYGTLFSLDLYRNADLLRAGALRVDEDLNVYSTIALSLRDQHHVRLAINTDLALISGGLDRLREWGSVIAKVIDAIDGSVLNGLGAPDLLGGRLMRKSYLDSAVELLNRTANDQIYQFNTVMSLMIEANKKEN